jgi:hypothetical protein
MSHIIAIDNKTVLKSNNCNSNAEAANLGPSILEIQVFQYKINREELY